MHKKAKSKKTEDRRKQNSTDVARTIQEFDRSPPERFATGLQPVTEEQRNIYEHSNRN